MHIIAPSEKLYKNNVFKHQFNGFIVSTPHCLPQTMVCNVVFLIGDQYLLAYEILSFYLIEKKSLHGELEIIEDRIHTDFSILRLEISRQGRGRERTPHVGHNIRNDSLKQIYVPYIVPLCNVFHHDRRKRIGKIHFRCIFIVVQLRQERHSSKRNESVEAPLDTRFWK